MLNIARLTQSALPANEVRLVRFPASQDEAGELFIYQLRLRQAVILWALSQLDLTYSSILAILRSSLIFLGRCASIYR